MPHWVVRKKIKKNKNKIKLDVKIMLFLYLVSFIQTRKISLTYFQLLVILEKIIGEDIVT